VRTGFALEACREKKVVIVVVVIVVVVIVVVVVVVESVPAGDCSAHGQH